LNIKKLNKLDDENEIKEQNETFKISDLNHDGNLNKEEANWAFMDLGYTFS
jgi:Ca2+-binding EF-hand superfamily protein